VAHNETLAFLGDAVLSFVVAQMLFESHPDASEGELSRFRASLVSGDALGEIALDLGIGQHLRRPKLPALLREVDFHGCIFQFHQPLERSVER